MANTKKDTKGRKLYLNEDQIKDGRYRYRYIDPYGKRQSIYAWKLIPTDKTPKGKREDLSLREKIKAIQKDLDDNIYSYDANSTVDDLIRQYLGTKVKLAVTTMNNYIHMWEKNIKGTWLGIKKINQVKKSDILRFYSYLYKERKFGARTLQLYQNLLYPAFQLAVDDSVIRLNPCNGCMKDFDRAPKKIKKALSRDEQKILLNFVKNNSYYNYLYPFIYFMLGTGTRMSETLGLTWENIDFKEKTVTIDHQVIYKKNGSNTIRFVAKPKNGESRIIPLQDDVIKVMKKHKEDTYLISKYSDFKIDGLKEFVFLNVENKTLLPNSVTRSLHGIVKLYNKEEELNADSEGREPIYLPDFTAHELRHTFCTRMAENGIDIKVLQKIMGHKNISVTMDIYNHVNQERIQDAIADLPNVVGYEI